MCIGHEGRGWVNARATPRSRPPAPGRIHAVRAGVAILAAVLGACKNGGAARPGDEGPAILEVPPSEEQVETAPDPLDAAPTPDETQPDPQTSVEALDVTPNDAQTVEEGPAEPPAPAAWVEIGLPFPKDFVFKGVWAQSGQHLFVAGAGPIAYRYDGATFEDLNPPAAPAIFNAVFGLSPTEVFFGGMHGKILRWEGAFSETTVVEPAGVGALFSISGTATGPVFAVGLGGVILRWDGESWRRSGISGARVFRGICADPVSGLWVVGSGGSVLRREDGVFRLVASPSAADLNGCAPGMIAVGGQGTALRAGPGGVLSSETVAFPDLEAVTGLPNGHAWAVGLDGVVVEFHPDGKTTLSSVANGKDLYAVHATSEVSVWAVGEAGTAVRYNGTFWIPKETGLNATLYGIHTTGAGSGMAVGASGVAAVLEAGVFTMVPSGTDHDLRAVLLTAPGEGVAVGAGGTILHWSGGAFSPVESPTKQDLFALAQDETGRLWAAGDRVVLEQRDDGTWRVALSSIAEDLRAVYVLDGPHAWAAGKAGAVYSFDGLNWARMEVEEIPLRDGGTMPFTGGLYGVWASAAGDVWVVGEAGAVLHSDGGRLVVRNADTQVTLRGIHGTGPKRFFIVGGGGTILRYDGVHLERETANSVATLYGVHATADGSVFAIGDGGTVLRRVP